MIGVTVYNKLVRDNIPAIIEESGRKATYRTLNDVEFRNALRGKLVEEATEVHDATTREEMIKELADVLEVIYHLANILEVDATTLYDIADEKMETNGGFDKRIFLESVEQEVRYGR